MDSGGHALCILSEQCEVVHHQSLRDSLVMPWSSLAPRQLVQCTVRGKEMTREPHTSGSSFTGQHGGDKYFKKETKKKPQQSHLTQFPTSEAVRGRCAINQATGCAARYRVQEPWGERQTEVAEGCVRSLYLLVSVELGGQLVSPPRRVLGTELRAAELAWGGADPRGC